jgi:phenylalanyl-tRNA synthetase alpha chain
MQADIQEVILKRLANSDSLDSTQLQQEYGLTHEVLYAELVSLVALNYIKLDNKKVARFVLTKEGQAYADQGTPEARIYQLASVEGTPKEIIEAELGAQFKIGFGNAMKKKIVSLKDNKIFRTKEGFEDEDKKKLVLVQEGKIDQLSPEDIKSVKSRKLVEEKVDTSFVITKGEEYRSEKVEQVPELSSAMIADHSWE